MPELPEVHTITQDLIKYAEKAEIKHVIVRGNYQVIPDNALLNTHVKNHKITRVGRLAKNIALTLSSQSTVVIHLAMTGRLLLRKPDHPADKWERVIFKLTKNNREFELRFCDMRMFGKVKILSLEELKGTANLYGPEPLDEKLHPEHFLQRIQSKNTTIKNVLLDQKIIAGLGNVYATDALWIAQIHPETKTSAFNLSMAQRLLEACREILQEGIKNRGITMSDYVDLFGKAGQQQNYFRVYQQEKCRRCGNETQFKQLGGRGTYFCSNCQIKGDIAQSLNL